MEKMCSRNVDQDLTNNSILLFSDGIFGSILNPVNTCEVILRTGLRK